MAEKKILVVDDEMRMRKLVGDFLKKEGYAVREAADGRQALEIFQREHPDLVILDVMMPEYDGWAVCREIRKTSRVPIIMLTARGEEEDELFGFDLGADEYIAKPFSLKILAARIQALFRRLENRQVAIRNYDGLEIDEPGRNVYVNGERIELTPKEFDLLLYLADNAGRALNRDQILNAVWNYDYFGDTRTVDTHIKRLRLKLGEKSELIQTVRGVGYRFEVKK
ncbi:MAG: response regulator transcription factor [Bacillota bacterium]|uniref:Stage 0 sporulation protein A homolog n=2 Tax=Carboxydocella TaxID=178898 RepID=A0A1T4Q9C9_9FIRM|nr:MULTISPECIES: response regulator transcription factor [Carboxydocella]AVX19351.1 DNA-binding response regulator, OmpR family, contains REC and winged-helix (wHTH) domain [Carboxydocella thermautotrophica]AVX29765.1 DNA-binding response regulator, OmpR family, contains REC and winged-helix (wHTH) domain [Carboxydocella thermautotrophica]GAW29164.1 DNA-binding response regulator [Carboxydocella sp. ULO1]SKA00410.1 DNA-binding response regulator, OmpR family, contains REC and winged-helix (wHTH